MWSWVLAVIGSCGLFFVGGKKVWGWFILILNEGVWVVYAIHTRQYGFIMYSFLYVIMYIRAIMNWNEKP
jgi:hypothetical protein